MSQVKISGNASGTGVLTIAAPNTNTDRSITIPDKAGEIAVGAGTIVQVVQGTTSTEVAITGTTYTDTGLSASITPTSSSNKVLIFVNQPYNSARDVVDHGFGMKLLRDSTEILIPTRVTSSAAPISFFFDNSNNDWGHINLSYLDSPSTTSSTTYKTQARPYFDSSNGVVRLQRGSSSAVYDQNPTSTIILMEVVA
jgi:hypothetical protein